MRARKRVQALPHVRSSWYASLPPLPNRALTVDLELMATLVNEVKAVQLGLITLEQVPVEHRLAVEALLLHATLTNETT